MTLVIDAIFVIDVIPRFSFSGQCHAHSKEFQ
jgi:hypothetical protein